MSADPADRQSRPGFSHWDDSGNGGETAGRRALRLALILGVHAALVAGLLVVLVRPETSADIERVYVRLVEAPPRVEPVPPPNEPPRPLAQPKVVPQSQPAPVLNADASAEPAAFAVAPQPPVLPAPVAVAVAQPPVVTEASFDADYLHNPKPAYPAMARRLNQEGEVLLRVRVSAEGNPLSVEIAKSSGFTLLDEAARNAVRQWRFVPARRGGEPIESWVGVPVVFRLDRPDRP